MKRRIFVGGAAAAALAAPVIARAQGNRKLNIAVIIKATDSDFWQYLLVGANNYAKEHPNIAMTSYGPASESDVDQQVAILENVISRRPDGILIAPSSSDAPAPAIAKAMSQGIPVITADNRVNGAKVAAHLATDNLKAGGLAAEQLVTAIKAAGRQPRGKIALISAYAGVEVLTRRDQGFTTRLAEIAPDLKILPPRYTNNDIQQAMSSMSDLILANSDMTGVFADNNHTGNGVALAIRDAKKIGTIPAVAFDSDPEEVNALGAGVLNALVVQDPYAMGYKGLDYVVRAINHETLPDYTDTGAYAVTKANMNEPKMKGLLNPLTLKT